MVVRHTADNVRAIICTGLLLSPAGPLLRHIAHDDVAQ
jgi:hypothetical protein